VKATAPSPTRDVQVERLDVKGRGVATSSEGRAVLVHGGLPGERVRVRIDGGGQHQDHGVVSELLSSSPDRVAPFCERVDECGGCAVQHLALSAQRKWKTGRVREALQSVGLDPDVVEDCQGVGETRGFRAKLLWMVETGPDGLLELGLFQPHSHALVALDACPVQDVVTESTLVPIREVLRRHAVSELWLRALLVRSNGSDAQVVLVAREDVPSPDVALLAEELVALDRVVGAFVNWTPPEGNALLGPGTRLLAGRERLRHAFDGFALEVSPTSFFQTHLGGAARLVEVVRDLSPERIGRVVDLYSGAGLFAAALADRATEVLAVEREGSSSRDGVHNLRALGRDSVRMEVAAVESHVRSAALADLVILDPPRAGCQPGVLEAVADRMRPERVLMVSCGLSGFARDAAALVGRGYLLDTVQPLDLFAHGPHVELVARLTRVAAPN